MAEQWLSIVEYARTFGISDMTIRRRIRTGRLQAHLRDGKYYIPIDRDPRTGEPVRPAGRPQKQPAIYPDVNQRQIASTLNSPAERSLNTTPRAPQQFSQSSSQHTPAYSHPNTTPYTHPHGHTSQARTTWGELPPRITAPIEAEQEVVVEAGALLDYCNSSLMSAKDLERHASARFQAQQETLQEQLKHRDYMIANLQQQIEDLQLLVQILEKKKT
jgi:hypothetical protein